MVLIACGSFSPLTFLHLRMFEMAADFARFNSNFEVCGAYLSAVGDAYKKNGLAKAEHRINMCNLAVEQSSWISVDPWEALHEEYLETAKVLDHFEHEINVVRGGIETANGEKKKARIALLAGADLIQTMSTPGVWAAKDIDYILSNFGAFIVEVSFQDIHTHPSDTDMNTANRDRHRRSPVAASTMEGEHLGHSTTRSERHLKHKDPPLQTTRYEYPLLGSRARGQVY